MENLRQKVVALRDELAAYRGVLDHYEALAKKEGDYMAEAARRLANETRNEVMYLSQRYNEAKQALEALEAV